MLFCVISFIVSKLLEFLFIIDLELVNSVKVIFARLFMLFLLLNFKLSVN